MLAEIALPAGIEIGNDLSYTHSTRGRWRSGLGLETCSVYLFSSLEITTFEMVGIWLVGAFTVLSVCDAGKQWYSPCKILVILKFGTNAVTKLFSPLTQHS